MMGKQDKQIQMIFLDIDSIVPENHLLRKIKNCINFDFIYEKASPYYAKNGRKSIDPVVLVKAIDWLSLWNKIREKTRRGNIT